MCPSYDLKKTNQMAISVYMLTMWTRKILHVPTPRNRATIGQLLLRKEKSGHSGINFFKVWVVQFQLVLSWHMYYKQTKWTLYFVFTCGHIDTYAYIHNNNDSSRHHKFERVWGYIGVGGISRSNKDAMIMHEFLTIYSLK